MAIMRWGYQGFICRSWIKDDILTQFRVSLRLASQEATSTYFLKYRPIQYLIHTPLKHERGTSASHMFSPGFLVLGGKTPPGRVWCSWMPPPQAFVFSPSNQ